MRIQAGLSQSELARLSGISPGAICLIEAGKTKPRDLTRRKILQALPGIQKENEQPEQDHPEVYPFGEILGRDEFFRRLKPKMNEKLNVFFSGPLISTLVDNVEFFSRQRYYPGDFATAVEVLSELLRAQRRSFMPDMAEDGDDGGGLKRGRRVLPGGYNKKCRKKR